MNAISINRRFYGCLGFALCALASSAPANASTPQPGTAEYTLELDPFEAHAGENAVDLTHAADATGRVFVSTQSGQVFAFDTDGRSLGVFLDIAEARSDFTRTDGSFNGLMYIAFHPDYARIGTPGFGRFYTGHQIEADDSPVNYDSKDAGASGDSDVRFVVAEWRVDPERPDRIDPHSYRPVLTLNFHTTASNPHALGELAFNPFAMPGDADYGNLYIAVGDSNNRNESGHTDLAYAQRVDNPFAKLLRIDPLSDDGKPYTIPPSNPFGNEVFALGLRNAQSYTFAKDLDGETILLAFDMGASEAEEINVVRLGGNYGWDRFEGTADYDTARELFSPASSPVAQYPHAFPTRPGEQPSGGPAAIIGGFVVSDPGDPRFRGQVLFADLPRGTLMHANLHHALSVEAQGKQSRPYVMNARLGDRLGTFADVIGADRADVRFGVDQAGSLYLVSKQTDTIYKTKLKYTGQPVEAVPRAAGQFTGGTRWAGFIIGGVFFALLIELVVVYKAARRTHPPHAAPPLQIAADMPPQRKAA